MLDNRFVFTDAVVLEIIAGPDDNPDYPKWKEIGELLDEIFNGVDEDGNDLPPREQTTPFSCVPFPL